MMRLTLEDGPSKVYETPVDLPAVRQTMIETSVKGKWLMVPALCVDDNVIVVKGKWLKVAIIEAEDWTEREVADPAACIQALKAQKRRVDIFTFVQKIPNTVPRYTYPITWESLAVIQLITFEQWWTRLPQETRKNVRRSEKRGVVVSVNELSDKLIHDLVDLNNDNPIRQGKRYTHFGKTFDQVKRDQLSYLDRSDYICAYFGDELVGLVKLVYSGTSASILTFLSKSSHADKRPSNALLSKAVEVCLAKGITHLVFGRLNYGNKRESSLKDFKLRHGFEEILVPRYHIPLSVWGSICQHIGLHKGLLGVLPPKVITTALSLRARCYSLYMHIAGVAQR